MHKLKFLPVALLLLMLTACQPKGLVNGEVQAPEFPWDRTYDEVIADLEKAGADYSSTDDWIEIQDTKIFGLDARKVELSFGDGQLAAVVGDLSVDEETGLKEIRAALGEPKDEFRQIMYQSEEEAPLAYEGEPYDDYCWAGTNTLADNLPEEIKEGFRHLFIGDYEEAQLVDREDTTEDGGRAWYGASSVDAVFTNPSSICLYDPSRDEVILQRYDLIFQSMVEGFM